MNKRKIVFFTSLVTLLLSSEKAMSAQLIIDTFDKGLVDLELTWVNKKSNLKLLEKVETNLFNVEAQNYNRKSSLLLKGGETPGNESNLRIDKYHSGVVSFNNDSSIYSKMSILYNGFTALDVSKFDHFDLNLKNNDQENSLSGFPLNTIKLTLTDNQRTSILNPSLTTVETKNNKKLQALRFDFTQLNQANSSRVDLEKLKSIEFSIDLPQNQHGRDITVDMVGFTTRNSILTTPEPVPTLGLLAISVLGIFSFLKRSKSKEQ